MRAVLGEELGCTVSTGDDSSNAETTAPTTALNDGSDIGCYTWSTKQNRSTEPRNGGENTIALPKVWRPVQGFGHVFQALIKYRSNKTTQQAKELRDARGLIASPLHVCTMRCAALSSDQVTLA